MVQTMIPKAMRPMKFYFSTVYQEIWVGVALTSYAYYKLSFAVALSALKGIILQILHGIIEEYVVA
uniref:68MP protein n=1 Tax=Catharus ustulatus TaxID=91951 RepID=A0A8C3TL32_CATUS